MSRNVGKINNFWHTTKNFFSTKSNAKFDYSKEQNGQLIISCKHPHLNHSSSVHYDTFNTVPLASKGWRHSKSVGDFFTVHPYKDNLNNDVYKFQDVGLHPNIIKALSAEKINEATEFQFRANQAVGAGNEIKFGPKKLQIKYTR